MRPHMISFSVLLLLSQTLMDCGKDSPIPTPTLTMPNKSALQVDTTIVRSDSLGKIGGAGFYCRFGDWREANYNSRRGDSVLQMLLDSNITVLEFWYPEYPSMCLDPFNHIREIVRLPQSDSTITHLGYDPLNAGFSDHCIPYWRHYKIQRFR